MKDRAMVAGVFYNRLNNNWSLGSDVTTYYAARKNLSETLTQSDLNDCNGYNTRCTSMRGLPVGPIDNPSLSAIEAALNPTENSYYYFVADTDKKSILYSYCERARTNNCKVKGTRKMGLIELENYAKERDIPIMQKEGIEFLKEVYQKKQSSEYIGNRSCYWIFGHSNGSSRPKCPRHNH